MSVFDAEFAWPGGDRPGAPDFAHEPPPRVAHAISRVLAPSFPPVMERDARLGALCPANDPAGRYRLVTPSGSWFVRVSSRWGDPDLERSLTDHLAGQGVPVNGLLVAGARLRWNERTYRVDVRPFIAGRHFDGSSADVESLSATLAACHRALVSFAGAAAVRAAASARFDRLAAARDLIVAALERDAFDVFAEHASWAREHRDWLARMTEDFEPRLDARPGAQCLHGQVHPGNALFRSDDGAAVLVDFEESVRLFAPPAWDVAFVVQRFCLRDDPAPVIGVDRRSIVSKGYGGPVSGLAEMMRQAAWFSIAAILDMRVAHGIVTPRDEYDKFVRLERQGRAFEGLL